MFELLMLIGFFSAVLSSLIGTAPKEDHHTQRPPRREKQPAHPVKRTKPSGQHNTRAISRASL